MNIGIALLARCSENANLTNTNVHDIGIGLLDRRMGHTWLAEKAIRSVTNPKQILLSNTY